MHHQFCPFYSSYLKIFSCFQHSRIVTKLSLYWYITTVFVLVFKCYINVLFIAHKLSLSRCTHSFKHCNRLCKCAFHKKSWTEWGYSWFIDKTIMFLIVLLIADIDVLTSEDLGAEALKTFGWDVWETFGSRGRTALAMAVLQGSAGGADIWPRQNRYRARTDTLMIFCNGVPAGWKQSLS